MIDLYGIKKIEEFPGYEHFKNLRGRQKAVAMETAISQDFGHHVRLIPYIQLHEFEALLFSDPSMLASAIGQPKLASEFQAVRDSVSNPEEINEGIQTAPSKRIERIYPAFDKTKDNIHATKAIGLSTLRGACPHFHAWLSQLENVSSHS